ncbi:hypothetical protein K3495_g13351 [Podosphaera aphanis]|nr:hypothetical protein K3495_g13351 [Podosphaera aphanis]
MSEQGTSNVPAVPTAPETSKIAEISNDPQATVASQSPEKESPIVPTGAIDKGKSKSIEPETTQDLSMEDADSSSDDEDQEVGNPIEDPDEENLKEIDPQNIIGDGRRTRGRTIDFSKPVEDEDDYNEDEDDDFVVAEDDEMKD